MPEKKKVVLVTGASSGIGEATVIYLADRGYHVVGAARRVELIPSHAHIKPVRMDVTDDASVASAVEEIIASAGHIDVVVNNAGTSLYGSVEETSISEIHKLFDLNIYGASRVSRAVLPSMRARRSGRIVNVTSLVGVLPVPYAGVYAASKHALEALSEAMDHETRQFGVRVAVVEPGFTRTNIHAATERVAHPIAGYDTERERVVAGMVDQLSKAVDPVLVARVIERAIEAKGFVRLTVGRDVAMLSILRRFLPHSLMDASVRKTLRVDG